MNINVVILLYHCAIVQHFRKSKTELIFEALAHRTVVINEVANELCNWIWRDGRIMLLLMLTWLAIAVVNSVNCPECNERVPFDATYSCQLCISALVYMSRDRVSGISVVKTG